VLRTETTVGGGLVLDPAPPRGLDPERLAVLDSGDPEAIVRALVYAPVTGAELQARGLLTPGELAHGLAALPHAGEYVFAQAWLDELRATVRERLAARAAEHPLDPGLPLAGLLPSEPWAPYVLNLLEVERRGGTAYLPGATAKAGRARRRRVGARSAACGRRDREGRRPRARCLPRRRRDAAPRRRRLRRLERAL
jgi:hypothetical protein